MRKGEFMYRFFFFSHNSSQCFMAKDRQVLSSDVGLKPVCFPQLDLVPLIASQQTSRSLFVSLFVSLSLPRGFHFLSVISHIRHCSRQLQRSFSAKITLTFVPPILILSPLVSSLLYLDQRCSCYFWKEIMSVQVTG